MPTEACDGKFDNVRKDSGGHSEMGYAADYDVDAKFVPAIRAKRDDASTFPTFDVELVPGINMAGAAGMYDALVGQGAVARAVAAKMDDACMERIIDSELIPARHESPCGSLSP
ncbi:hypothetical protein [Streptomyces sp. NPDC002133]|uniref:hypothetical protein n=1 Tax=Streptomyces sp. NPDC002133 TaxID=3154409 RepID=UPI00332B8B2B